MYFNRKVAFLSRLGRKSRRYGSFLGPLLVLLVAFQFLVGSLVPVLMAQAQASSNQSLVVALSKLCRTVNEEGRLSDRQSPEADCLSCSTCCYGELLPPCGMAAFSVILHAEHSRVWFVEGIFKLNSALFLSRAPPA